MKNMLENLSSAQSHWLFQGFYAPFLTAALQKDIKSGEYQHPETDDDHKDWVHKYAGALNADFWYRVILSGILLFSASPHNPLAWLLAITIFSTLASLNWWEGVSQKFTSQYWRDHFHTGASANPLAAGIGRVVMLPVSIPLIILFYLLTCPVIWWFLLLGKFTV